MAIEWAFLRSKVARRLLLLFVACALLPIAVLTAFALERVSEDLHEQSRARLQRASKASGVFSMGLLLELETELADLAARLRVGARPRLPPVELLGGLGLAREDGETLAATAGFPELGLPSPRGWAHLRSGKTLLRTVDDPAAGPRVLLTRLVRGAAGQDLLLTGEARLDHVLGISVGNTLPPGGEFCVIDEAGRVLRCSFAGEASPPAPDAWRQGVSGGFDWPRPDGAYVARYWSLFLEPAFAAPSWTFVVAESRSEVFAPIAHFRRSFPATVLACLLAMALLGTQQIRRRLRPLDELREATRLVAEGRFDVSVRIESGDEFEDLAESFNAMASRLGLHFATLDALGDIDRSMLPALTVPEIAEVLLGRLRDLYPCSSLTFLVLPFEGSDTVQCFVSRHPSDPGRAVDLPQPTDAEAELLSSRPDALHIDVDGCAPSFLAPLRDEGARVAVVLPLFVKGALAGAIACGDPESQDAQERLTVARQVANQVAMALANVHNIEENRVLAYYDALTGLPNRLLFKEHARQALAEGRRHRRQVAICLLDLDGFKGVNDTLGHEAGDRLLCQVAERVSQGARSGTVARLGGDEFTLLMSEVAAAEDAARLSQRVLDAVAHPYEIDGREIFVTASLGITLLPDDGTDLDILLRNADAAMYAAKAGGGNQYRFFTPIMHEAARHRLELEADLRRALERREFQLFYQPIVDVESRELSAAEALIRWQHRERGLTPPEDFVAVAEQSGLIEPIGDWVIREACAQVGAWLRQGLEPPRISVNVTARQIRSGSLVEAVTRAVLNAGIPGRHLALELTESTLMERPEEVQAQLLRLRELGLRVSIDDFGTGYSSLSYLKHFRADTIKVDRSFVSGLPGNPEEASIVRAVIALARGLGLEVVAEGVETQSQLAFLREHHCQMAQGYLFSAPLPADVFEKLLRERASR